MNDLPAPPLLASRPEWFDRARCRELDLDTDLFFPSRDDDVIAAQLVCERCPVRVDCLAYALENGEHFGIWGGESERARRRLRRSHGLLIERRKRS